MLSGGRTSVTGGQDFGADGGNAWRIVGLTNGGATNVLFFCVGICSDDGGGNGRVAMYGGQMFMGRVPDGYAHRKFFMFTNLRYFVSKFWI